MILLVGIFCLSLYAGSVLSVEIADGDNRVERAILGENGGNHLLEALGGGSPGRDFPVLNTVPKTNFDCHGLLPGYYADENYGCQVFHVCHTDQRKDSFLCPNGTIFHQVKLVCDWWYNVDCASTNLHFDVNLEFGKPSSNFGGGSKTKIVQPAVPSQSTSFQDTSNHAQQGGSRVSSQLSQFGNSGSSHFAPSRGSSQGEQATQFGRGSGALQSSHFSGNVNDVSSQSMPFGISKIDQQPNFSQFDLDRDKPVLSQTSFNSAPSRSQNHHQSSFQTNFNNQGSPVRTRQDSSRGGVNQFVDHRHAVKEVKINKRPVSPTGIPFPSPLSRQSDTNLAQRSGRVLPTPSQIEADPIPTTLSPRSHNFQVPNSLISPPRKVETSVRSSHGTFDSSKVHNKPLNGKVSAFKKVTVNKRPIASISNVGGKQEVRILDDSRAANQFFNLGTPVQVAPRTSFGRPLPKSDVKFIKKTVTKTQANVKTPHSNIGRPLPPANNINNFGRPAPRVQATTLRSTIRNQNLNNIGVPLPPPQSNIRSNAAQKTNVGRPLPINQVHVQSNVAQQRPATRAQGQANTFGRPLPIIENKLTGTNVRTSTRNNNRGSVTFGTSQQGGNQGGQVTRTRRPTVAVNQPAAFTVLLDDDDLDDLNDPFDDDRFDDDRFDDDRFDDDRFDDDRFDDDRFDNDRFDDDRIDNDRFKVKVRSKFDDDRFDNDPFDDDRFDFDDDDDDDDDFDDRRNRFDNSGNFNFGRRPRGSTSSLLVAHKGDSNNGQPIVVEITPPPEIQLPPPLPKPHNK